MPYKKEDAVNFQLEKVNLKAYRWIH